MSTDIPAEPEGFDDLCCNIGLAILIAQKVQLALAKYYAAFMATRHGWNNEQRNDSLSCHLKSTLGAVVKDISRKAHMRDLLGELWWDVLTFKDDRNWIAHNFDEEATPFLAKGRRIPEYAERMHQIAESGHAIMRAMESIGDALIAE